MTDSTTDPTGTRGDTDAEENEVDPAEAAAEALPTGPVDPDDVGPRPAVAAEAVQAHEARDRTGDTESAPAETTDTDTDEDEDVEGLVYERDADEEEAARPEPVESPYDRPGRWYVVHTQSGYENKVKQNLEARIGSMNMEGRIHEVVIPTEDVTEFKNGRKVVVQRKMFPGYLLVRAGLDDDTWYVIRQTPGVTGFVGAGNKPSPLPRRDVETFLQVKPKVGPVAKRGRPKLEYELGETVRVREGPFADFSGEIVDINEDQLKVKVLVNIFGRETPVELEFGQVARL